MILQIGKYERNAFYFDCWLSGYDLEREYLFIGGYAAIQIRNILQFSSDKDDIQNYSDHLKLMQCFLSLISNKHIDQQQIDSLPQNNKILPSLIQQNSRSNLPEYIITLYQFRCIKINEIMIDLSECLTISTILNINNILLDDTQSMIDMNLLAQIFPNVSKITIYFSNSFKFSNAIIQYLYTNLSQYHIRSHCITNIEFDFGTSLIPPLIRAQIASELQDDFDNIGWVISIENNEENNECIHFIKIKALNNPNYRPISSALRVYSKSRDSAAIGPLEDDHLVSYVALNTKDNDSDHEDELAFPPIIFDKMVPYTKCISSIEALKNIYPFLSEYDDTISIEVWRTHSIIVILLHLIIQLNYATQIWFIFVGDSPFRWIVLGFFCWLQLGILVGISGAAIAAVNELHIEEQILLLVACLFFCGAGILLVPS